MGPHSSSCTQSSDGPATTVAAVAAERTRMWTASFTAQSVAGTQPYGRRCQSHTAANRATGTTIDRSRATVGFVCTPSVSIMAEIWPVATN